MNNKVLLDHTFFKALLFDNNKNHEYAVELASYLDSYQLYMLDCELIKCMDMIKSLDINVKQDFFKLINDITQIIYIRQNDIYSKVLNIYCELDGKFSYSECLNIYFIHYKKFDDFVSFEKKYDGVDAIKRIQNIGRNW